MKRVAHNAKSWEQHKKEAQAVYDQKGKPWTITGWIGEWKGAYTKIVACCADHGEWKTTAIHKAKEGKGCPGCKRCKLSTQRKTQRKTQLLPDSVHIEAFIKACPDNIPRTYTRSDSLNTEGKAVYWIVECSICSHDEYVKAGLCSGRFESQGANLKSGQLSCRCSKQYKFTSEQWIYRMTKACQERGDQFVGFVGKVESRSKFKYMCSEHGQQSATVNNYLNGQGCPGCKNKIMQEFYINVILDEYGEDTGAYKLGIAKDSDIRIKGQNKKNNYTMQRVALFDMPSYQACRELESKLKSKTDQILPSIGCVEALHMKDGHSETFLREDLAVVLSAINQAGGIMRQEENYVS